MSKLLDQMTDDELGLIASAVRKWTKVLLHAGFDPGAYVSRSELDACVGLMDKCPAPATPEEGEHDATPEPPGL